MKASFFVRYGLIIAAITVFFWPIVGVGALRALKSNHNDVEDWLPASYPETKSFHWFSKHFAGEEFVLASWDGISFDDQRIRLMAEKIVPAERDSSREEHFYFKSVISGGELVKQLTGEPLNLDRDDALERLKGTLVGRDGKTTCMIFTLDPFAKSKLRKAVARVRDVATKECNIPLEKLHLGGPAVDSAAMDEAGERSLLRLASVAGLVGVGISWWCLRSKRLIAMVFFTGVYCASLSLAIVYFTGTTMNAILMTMPSLVYVAAISAAIHLSNYYRDSAAEEGLVGAPSRALRHAALPLGLATSTTAIGLVSLLTSELIPIQLFGLYSAIGVVVSLVPLCFFLPAAFELWPLRAEKLIGNSEPVVSKGPEFSPIWRKIGQGIVDHHAPVTVGGIALLAVFGWYSTQIQTSTQLMRMFRDDSKICQDYQWLEKNIGDLVPMEIVFKFDNDVNELRFVDRMRLIEHLESRVKSVLKGRATSDDLASTMSAATFIGPKLYQDDAERRRFNPERILAGEVQKFGITGSGLRASTLNKTLEKKRQQFVDLDFLENETITGDEGNEKHYELWRISARVSALKDVDFELFQQDLQAEIDKLLGDDDLKAQRGISVVYTGLVPLIDKSQRSLLNGLFIGFATDLVVVTIVMILAIREWSAGIVLFLPSIFPVVIVFGFMGLAGIVVDTGTVMAPGVALGVTIDDVVHFMLKYRQALEAGSDRKQAIMFAYKGCARPMYQSWGVIGIGLSAFALAPFTPTQRFGYLMVTLLTAALIGNLVVLPAVLAGPFGALFGRKFQVRRRQIGASVEADEGERSPAMPHLRSRLPEESLVK